MSRLLILWFAVKTVLCTCGPDYRANDFEKVRSQYKISKIGKLPSVANESSGLAAGLNNNSFWTHNDSGGKTELYEIDSTGKLLSTKSIAHAKNTDWEDLARDKNGTIYIGDFGNNSNTRRSLDIYKVAKDRSEAERITFHYASQTAFPPPPEQQNFDCEAFFHSGNSLYLFSKNRSKTNHYVKLYRLPDEPGDYAAVPFDSIGIKTQVTSADISPDGKTFALLTYGKILIFGVTKGEINFKKPLGCFRFVKKQAEALIFLNNSDMLVTNEQGEIYRITRR